jgi:hypothetical protein
MGVSKHSSCRFDPRCAIIGGGALARRFFLHRWAFFILGNILFGCICLLAFVVIAYSTMKDRKTYKENCI